MEPGEDESNFSQIQYLVIASYFIVIMQTGTAWCVAGIFVTPTL